MVSSLILGDELVYPAVCIVEILNASIIHEQYEKYRRCDGEARRCEDESAKLRRRRSDTTIASSPLQLRTLAFETSRFRLFSSPRRSQWEHMLYPRRRRPELVKVLVAAPVSKLLLVLSSPKLHG